MKPDWKDAPEWANYLAMDKSGDWHWYEDLPLINDTYYEWHNKGKLKFSRMNLFWKDTLEKRPDK